MCLMVYELEMLVLGWTGALAATRLTISLTDEFGMLMLGWAGASVVMGLRAVLMSELRVIIVSCGILALGRSHLRTGRLDIKMK